ncbi:MAG: hemolysin family protein [Polyangiaceae bacterium]
MAPESPPASDYILAALPALLAAAFGAASTAIGALSVARRVALRDSLQGPLRRALDRYLMDGRAIEARWLALRVLGIAVTASLLGRLLPQALGGWTSPLAALLALVLYGLPAEISKAIVLRAPESAAPRLLSLLRPFEWVVMPLAAPLVAVGRLVGQSVAKGGSIPPDARVREQEVELLVAESEQSGVLDHEQSEMIRNVLEFRDLTAGDVMVPRTRIMAFEIDTPVDQIIREAADNGHSRYPVYRERIDNVVGVLHIKDLLTRSHDSEEAVAVTSVMRTPVAFVPETFPASSALRDMRAGRHHLAVVIDEHGGIAGIVTLEDLVEEIVGEIQDEHDSEDPPVVRLPGGRLLVDASISIGDLERYLGTDLPEDGDYHSLGGFVVERLGRVPRPGARFVAQGHEFLVRDADARHVSKVEIAPARRSHPDGGGDSTVSAA